MQASSAQQKPQCQDVWRAFYNNCYNSKKRKLSEILWSHSFFLLFQCKTYFSLI